MKDVSLELLGNLGSWAAEMAGEQLYLSCVGLPGVR